MNSNSRWFLDTQHSSSFKAEHEIFRALHDNIKIVIFKKIYNKIFVIKNKSNSAIFQKQNI